MPTETATPPAADPPPAARRPLSFDEVVERVMALPLPDVDLVVGIATGGTVPAGLVAFRLGVPLSLMQVNYRDPDHRPRRPRPERLDGAPPPPPGTRVLLVDDVAVSGATLALARDALAGCEVTTLVLKGRADLVAFPDVATCVVWPWARLAGAAPG